MKHKNKGKATRNTSKEKQADEALKMSEERLRHLVKFAPTGIAELDLQKSRFLSVNDVVCELSGYTQAELLTMGPLDLMTADSKTLYLKRRKKALEGKPDFSNAEYTIKTKDGKEVVVLINSKVRLNETDKATTATVVLHDITERKRIEEALRQSEEKYYNFLNNLADGVFVLDRSWRYAFMNNAALQLVKLSREEFLGNKIFDVFPGIENTTFFKAYENTMQTGQINNLEDSFPGPDGKKRYYQIRAAAVPEGVIVVARDITVRRRAEEKLKESLTEKEVLLKEIHHRVKNNMNLVNSLLKLQSMRIKDKNTRTMFKDTRNRVRSMALVHEKLYQSRDFARINISKYLRSMIVHLFRSYDINANDIKLNIDLQDTVLDITRAIPCGLIVNELVTNCLKHSFPEGKSGEIHVILGEKEGEHTLVVRDSGIGIPKDVNFEAPETLGLQVVSDLVDQLNGTIALKRGKGTTFKIQF